MRRQVKLRATEAQHVSLNREKSKTFSLLGKRTWTADAGLGGASEAVVCGGGVGAATQLVATQGTVQ